MASDVRYMDSGLWGAGTDGGNQSFLEYVNERSPRVTSTKQVGSPLEGFVMPPEWIRDGLCAQTDPEVFFPPGGGSPQAAKRVCASCPVRDECREYAIDNYEEGVWGGTTERERREIRKEREAESA